MSGIRIEEAFRGLKGCLGMANLWTYAVLKSPDKMGLR